MTRLGISEHTVTGVENGFVTVQLEPLSGNIDDLNIVAGAHYMATVETTTEIVRPTAMQIADDDSYDYSAAIFNARQTGMATGDLSQFRYAHSFAITSENRFRISPSTTGDLTTGNFNESTTPLIRLGFEALEDVETATVEINKNISIAVSPNPTASDITVNLATDEATDMEVSIIDIAGRVISTKSYDAITELKEEFNLSALTNGVYLVHISTPEGVQTQKFIVSK